MNILGLNAYHGDASSALLSNGNLVAAVEEERFNRIKHWAGLPLEATRSCLRQGQVEHVEHLAVSRDPKAHFWKKVGRVAIRPYLWKQAMIRSKNLYSVSQIPAMLAAGGIQA